MKHTSKPKYGCADSIKRFPPSVYTILGYFCYDCRRTKPKGDSCANDRMHRVDEVQMYVPLRMLAMQ